MVRALILDLDGTVYVDSNPIKNVVKLLSDFNESGGYIQFLTNNTSVSKVQYVQKLRKMNLNFVTEDSILSPIDSFIVFAKEKEINSCFYLLPEVVIQYIQSQGGPIFNSKSPEIVLVGFDKELTYKKLQISCEFINSGIDYYITHIDLACPSENGPIPDCGSIANLIKNTTNMDWKSDFGKPGKILAELISVKLEKMGISPEKGVLVGDRYYTDIVMGNNMGLKTCHVNTGENYTLKIEDPDSFNPTYEYEDICEFIQNEILNR